MRPAPSTTEPWRFAQTTSSGSTSSVLLRMPRRDASTRSQSTPAKSGSAVGLRANRPAPRAGEHREQADEEGGARRGAARARRGGGEREGEEHERDPEQDHRAHPGERVRGVEDDLGEPLLIGPRRSLAEEREVLRVGKAVVDDLAARHQRQPGVADDDRRREERRGARSRRARRAGSGTGSSRGRWSMPVAAGGVPGAGLDAATSAGPRPAQASRPAGAGGLRRSSSCLVALARARFGEAGVPGTEEGLAEARHGAVVAGRMERSRGRCPTSSDTGRRACRPAGAGTGE